MICKSIQDCQDTIYFAKFDDGSWYRARIIKKFPNENNVNTFFLMKALKPILK